MFKKCKNMIIIYISFKIYNRNNTLNDLFKVIWLAGKITTVYINIINIKYANNKKTFITIKIPNHKYKYLF